MYLVLLLFKKHTLNTAIFITIFVNPKTFIEDECKHKTCFLKPLNLTRNSDFKNILLRPSRHLPLLVINIHNNIVDQLRDRLNVKMLSNQYAMQIK